MDCLAREFGTVIALDSRYEGRGHGENGVLHTNRPEDLAAAEALFVLTPKGADMDELASMQEAFDRAATELGFRARLAPHRNSRARSDRVPAVAGPRVVPGTAAGG